MSNWEQICRDRLAAAQAWDPSDPLNRSEVRLWRARLWWSKFGGVASAASGMLLGAGVLLVWEVLA